jgi:hypothetical protein
MTIPLLLSVMLFAGLGMALASESSNGARATIGDRFASQPSRNLNWDVFPPGTDILRRISS